MADVNFKQKGQSSQDRRWQGAIPKLDLLISAFLAKIKVLKNIAAVPPQKTPRKYSRDKRQEILNVACGLTNAM
jgi:hypothetical protein